jgi:hypothetical protein
VATVACALLLPRVGGALAAAAGFERAVICTGDRLVVVTLSPGGAPVELAEAEDHPCPHAAATARPPAPDALRPAAVARAPAPREAEALPRAALWQGPPPTRAPPARR